MTEQTSQAWPTRPAELLIELHVTVQIAKANGKNKLTARRLTALGKRYDALIRQGKKLNR